MLVWIPCALLVVFTPLEMYFIRQSRAGRINGNILQVLRIIGTFFLMFILLISFITACILLTAYPGEIFPVHFVTPIIQICTFMLAMFLSTQHRLNGIRSSGLIFIFWFTLTVFGIPQLRTEIRYLQSRIAESDWRYFKAIIFIVYFIILVFVLILFCFADKRPANSIPSKNPSPEESASFPRKLFYHWFDALIWKGYWHPLKVSDLWDPLEEDLTQNITPNFDKYWKESVEENDQKKTKYKLGETHGTVLPAMIRPFGSPFWFAGFLKLVVDLLSFASPHILG